MSILIKNMEMPKNCSGCPLNYDQMACKVTGTRWWSDTMVLMDFDSDKERLYDCPLVEIPTPHGRLIDGDKFYKVMCSHWVLSLGEAYKRLEEFLEKPVIEAEGSDE